MILKENPSDKLLDSEDRGLRVAAQSSRIFPLVRKSDDLDFGKVGSKFDTHNIKIEFPSTRFYGSKRRHLDWLKREFEVLPGQTALDAFGGTGAVSHLLAKLGWRTTYNDIFEFNIISARAIFSKSTIFFTENKLQSFLSAIVPFSGFISETFSGLYFYQEENLWLDGFMAKLEFYHGEERDLLLYCLFQACLKKRPFNLFHRANLNLRDSVIPVQFGNRTTWNKTFPVHIMQTYRELHKFQAASSNTVSVMQSPTVIHPGQEYDLVYLDPPYFKKSKRNTDTYLQRYHFLEGLARFAQWPSLIDESSSQKMIRSPYRGELTNKRSLVEEIQQVINAYPNASFALSYVSGEEPSEEELFNLFSKNFDTVRLSRRSFSKVLSNKKAFEILLTGK